jgi:glutamate synthase domain-containing protein 2
LAQGTETGGNLTAYLPIEALSAGARMGGFAQDTGEGSISVYHRNGGGDLIWQIASGYFGCRDARDSGIYIDFIVVDGAEGGTGAAPVEFSNNLGMPLHDGLVIVRNALVGTGLRDRIRLGASGKVHSQGLNDLSRLNLTSLGTCG